MRMMMFVVCVIQLGCATVDYKRDLFDEKGKTIGHVTVVHKAATSDAAVAMLAEAQRAEESGREHRTTEQVIGVAHESIDRGKPTALNTPHGSVESGYVGYGYGPYGQLGYGAMQNYPGVSQEMMLAEQLWQQQSQGQQPWNVPNVPNQLSVTGSEALAQCPSDRPPANLAEQTACIRRDVNAIIRSHTPRSGKRR